MVSAWRYWYVCLFSGYRFVLKFEYPLASGQVQRALMAAYPDWCAIQPACRLPEGVRERLEVLEA